jgi:hypothetical protein
MSVTNTSASLSTARRRQLVLYSWRAADQYSYNPLTKKAEQAPSHGNQGTGPSRGVSLAAYVGAQLVGQTQTGSDCSCGPNTTLQGYVKQAPALCNNINP